MHVFLYFLYLYNDSYVHVNEGGQISYDAVTAGSNGYLYLWSNGLCSTATRVDKAVFTLTVTTTSAIPYAVVCTAKGTIKVYDARTLLPLTKCILTSSLPQSAMSNQMPTSSSSYAGSTPRSARSVSGGNNGMWREYCFFITRANLSYCYILHPYLHRRLDVSILGMTEIPANSSKLTNITLAVAMANGVCEQVMIGVPSKSAPAASKTKANAQALPEALQLPMFHYHTACVNAVAVLR